MDDDLPLGQQQPSIRLFQHKKGSCDAEKKRLTMRQIRELLRLKTCEPQLGNRVLAQRLGVARSTAQDFLNRLAATGLSWPLPDELTDDVLEQRLFCSAGRKSGIRASTLPVVVDRADGCRGIELDACPAEAEAAFRLQAAASK